MAFKRSWVRFPLSPPALKNTIYSSKSCRFTCYMWCFLLWAQFRHRILGTGSVRRREVGDREGADAKGNIYFFNLLLTFGVKRVIICIYICRNQMAVASGERLRQDEIIFAGIGVVVAERGGLRYGRGRFPKNSCCIERIGFRRAEMYFLEREGRTAKNFQKIFINRRTYA